MVIESMDFFEGALAIRKAMTGMKKHMILDKLDIVSDRLPAVFGLLDDMKSLHSELPDDVWLAAGGDIWDCYDACNSLQKKIRGAHKDLKFDLDNGISLPLITKELDHNGEKAESFLCSIHGAMKRLQPSGIATNILFLSDIENALTHLTTFKMVLESIDFVNASIEACEAVEEEDSTSQELNAVSDKLRPLRERLGSIRSQWRNRELVDLVWICAQAEFTSVHTACKRLANSLRSVCSLLRMLDADLSQSVLKDEIQIADRQVAEVYTCLEMLSHRMILINAALLKSIKALTETLSRERTSINGEAQGESISRDGESSTQVDQNANSLGTVLNSTSEELQNATP